MQIPPYSRLVALCLISLAAMLFAACSTNNTHTTTDGGLPADSFDTSQSADDIDPDDTNIGDTDTADTADTAENQPTACAPFAPYTRTGQFASDAIDESSGLAASWRYDDLLWTHNDSGDTARLFLIRTDGALVAEVHLADIPAVDWEDMAIGPCSTKPQAPACIYVGDIGDNLKRRENVVIYRFEEPTIPAEFLANFDAETPPLTLKVEAVDAIWFTYPEGPRDAETLMVHPQTAAIYIIEKNDTPDAPVFRVPNPEPGISSHSQEPARATQIATLHHAGLSGLVAMLTAGAIAPDGREFTVRTYLQAFTYCLPEHETADTPESFETIFSADPVPGRLPLTRQGEALTYARSSPPSNDNTQMNPKEHALWITSEGANAPIFRVQRNPAAIAE